MTSRINRWSVVAFVLVALCTTPVSAGHGDQELTFDEIGVSVTDRDQLRITYAIDEADWARLEHEGVHPELNVYTEDEDEGDLKYAYNFDVPARRGSLTLPTAFDAFDLAQFQIEVLGFAGTFRIERLGARGVSGARLAFIRSGNDFSLRAVGAESCRLAVDDIDGIGGSDGANESDESEVSDGSDTSDDSEETEEESPPENWNANVIQACNDMADFDSNMKSCTKLAMKIEPRWAADTVGACASVFDFNSKIESCLEAATRYDHHDPSAVVEACGGVSDYNSTIQSCIESGAEYTENPVPVVRACTEAASFDSKRVECIQLGQKLGENGAAVIRACSGRSVADCIHNASGR